MRKRYNSTIHRRLYIKHHGSIPIDENGRSYEIHHIDGNHENNDISNLMAVSIREHYEIHKSQGDYNACALIAKKMKLSAEELSKLNKKIANDSVKNGTHPWLGGEVARNQQKKLVEKKIHHLQKDSPNNVNKSWSCNFCGKIGTTNGGKSNHLKFCKNNPNRSKSPNQGVVTSHSHKWTCSLCGKMGSNSGNYTQHRRSCLKKMENKNANV